MSHLFISFLQEGLGQPQTRPRESDYEPAVMAALSPHRKDHPPPPALFGFRREWNDPALESRLQSAGTGTPSAPPDPKQAGRATSGRPLAKTSFGLRPDPPRRAQRPGELGCWRRKCWSARGPDPTAFSRGQATRSDTAGAGAASAKGSSLWPSFRTPPRPGLGRPWSSVLRLSEVSGAASEQLDSGSRGLQCPVEALSGQVRRPPPPPRPAQLPA